jgi:hypothetical protein
MIAARPSPRCVLLQVSTLRSSVTPACAGALVVAHVRGEAISRGRVRHPVLVLPPYQLGPAPDLGSIVERVDAAGGMPEEALEPPTRGL